MRKTQQGNTVSHKVQHRLLAKHCILLENDYLVNVKY